MRRVCLITGAGGVLGTAFRRRHAGEYDVAAIIRSRPVWVPSQDKHIVDPLDPGRMIDAGATQVHEIRVDLMSQASPGQPAREVADRIVDIDRGDGTGDVLLMETGP